MVGFHIDGTAASGPMVEGISLQQTSDIVLHDLTFEGFQNAAVHSFIGLGNSFTSIKMQNSPIRAL